MNGDPIEILDEALGGCRTELPVVTASELNLIAAQVPVVAHPPKDENRALDNLLDAREEWLTEKPRSSQEIDGYDTGMYDTLSQLDADLASEFYEAVKE